MRRVAVQPRPVSGRLDKKTKNSRQLGESEWLDPSEKYSCYFGPPLVRGAGLRHHNKAARRWCRKLLIVIIVCAVLLLRLNQMYYVLCLSYHSNTEAVLFECLSSGWATTTSKLLGPKVGNSIKCLS